MTILILILLAYLAAWIFMIDTLKEQEVLSEEHPLAVFAFLYAPFFVAAAWLYTRWEMRRWRRLG